MLSRNKKEIILIAWGAIGDAVVSTPAIRALKKNNPDKKLILYHLGPRHYAVFKNNPHIDSLRLFTASNLLKYPGHAFEYVIKGNKQKFIRLSFQFVPPSYLYDKNIKQVVADIFDLQIANEDIEIHLTQAEDKQAIQRLSSYKNTVIMHIYSRSSPNHLWPLDRWNSLVRSLPEYTFIQLGNRDEPQVKGAVDWRGKTQLREAFALVKHADSFVGVDSSLSHVTNAFQKPGVVLFGDSSPALWGHTNNINIYKAQACSPCYYDLHKNPCPYHHECMTGISVEEVRESLIFQMGSTSKAASN